MNITANIKREIVQSVNFFSSTLVCYHQSHFAIGTYKLLSIQLAINVLISPQRLSARIYVTAIFRHYTGKRAACREHRR